MKELTIIESAHLPNEDDIRAFEKQISRSLPDVFKSFLLAYNPKFTLETTFTFNKKEYTIANWLPFSSTKSLSLQEVHNILIDYLEGKYLAFALNSADWLFLISINDTDYGQIYFLRSDKDLEDGLIRLSEDFGKFTDGLENTPQ